jgi:hypothetical protein
MKGQTKKIGNAAETNESFQLELERTQRELEECRDRLEQLDEQLQVYKKAETLLQGAPSKLFVR